MRWTSGAGPSNARLSRLQIGLVRRGHIFFCLKRPVRLSSYCIWFFAFAHVLHRRLDRHRAMVTKIPAAVATSLFFFVTAELEFLTELLLFVKVLARPARSFVRPYSRRFSGSYVWEPRCRQPRRQKARLRDALTRFRANRVSLCRWTGTSCLFRSSSAATPALAEASLPMSKPEPEFLFVCFAFRPHLHEHTRICCRRPSGLPVYFNFLLVQRWRSRLLRFCKAAGCRSSNSCEAHFENKQSRGLCAMRVVALL